MNFMRGLLAARSHLAFLLGLAIALLIVQGVRRMTGEPGTGGGEREVAVRGFEQELKLPDKLYPLRPTGAQLTEAEQRWARSAWSYFEKNTQPATGLVNSVDGYPSTTLWDTGSYLMGLLGAEALGIVNRAEADRRLTQVLGSLEKLPLCDGKLPNKAYNTLTLEMVDYANNPRPDCIGWSAIDVARIGVPFNVLAWERPEFTPQVRRILTRWGLQHAAANGALQGTDRPKSGQLVRVQEGRFGYEQYAGKSLFLLGLPVGVAMDYKAFIELSPVEGQLIAHDRRKPEEHEGTHNAVLSEPYILEGVEFGLDAVTLPLARSVLYAQQKRFEKTGKLTAVSEDQLDRDPRFIYSSVISGDKPWAVFTPDGRDAENLRILSTKTLIGWGVLFDGNYPAQLLAAVDEMVTDSGLYAGKYEQDGSLNRVLTANTNGIILEVLAYRVHGPWLPGARQQRPATGGAGR
ncbi:uncharacterized protein DUF3131 [Archangium gephyra]|uniref:Uncharacterized protein DUF3131 n=1 Tax=Archangium gephyra TaxID=48 RepID=A0ABX9JYD0_9BACT|nr:DUF3131 domain-containing protein [Archangium gephyra]REG29487.1 uncharacterized protein DUF3131 [Archangium gephyra]